MMVGQLIKERIEDAQRMRGWFVNSYAQIEFLLGAFLYEAYELPEYADLCGPLPHGVGNRAKKAKKIIERDGPMRLTSMFVEHALPRFLRHDEVRNLIVHGFCQYVFTKDGAWAMRYTKWHRDPTQPGETLRMTRDFDKRSFERELREIQDLAKEVVLNLSDLEKKYSTVEH